MRKVIFASILITAFVLVSSVSFANVFASDISAPASFDRGTPAETATIQYRLNDDADEVRVHIYGPLPSTSVKRILDVTESDPAARPGTSRGMNSVVWDGYGEAGAPIPASGAFYGFRIYAAHAGYPGWTNITPLKAATLTVDWATSTGVYGGDTSGNEFRDIAYHEASDTCVITATNPVDKISVVSATDGSYIRELSLTTVDTYDADNDANTTETSSWAGWLGPYAVKSDNTQDIFYVTPYSSGNITGRFTGTDVATSVSTWAALPGYSSRSNAVAGSGANTLIYIGAAVGTISVFDTADGLTYSLLENTGVAGSHVVIAKPDNTGGDGDVIWAQETTAPGLKRYVRTGGSWVEDTNFVIDPAILIGFHHGDYAYIGDRDNMGAGKQVLFCASAYHLSPYIVAIDGETGDMITSTTVPTFGTPINSATAGLEVHQISSGSGTVNIYFGMGHNHVYGKLTFNWYPIPTAYWYSAKGIACVRNQADPNFGRILVAEAYPSPSTVVGAEDLDQQGIWLLNSDMTLEGLTTPTAYPDGNAVSVWDAANFYDPWHIKIGIDDDTVYVADYHDGYENLHQGDTDWSAGSIGRVLSTDYPSYHGNVMAAQSAGTGVNRVIFGIDEDYKGVPGAGSAKQLYRWDVGTVTSDYDSTPVLIIAGPGGTVNATPALWHMRDVEMTTTGALYLANYRWDPYYGQAGLTRAEPDGTRTDELYNGNSGSRGWVAGSLAQDMLRAHAVSTNTDRWGAICRYGMFQVGPLDMSGAELVAFEPFWGTTSDNYCDAMGADAAGNFLVVSSSNEMVNVWSPPGSNYYETTYIGQVQVFSTRVPDWELF